MSESFLKKPKFEDNFIFVVKCTSTMINMIFELACVAVLMFNNSSIDSFVANDK